MRPAPDRQMPPRFAAQAPVGPVRALAVVAGALLASSHSGCVNVMVMAGKAFFGDGHVMSAFEQRTGVSLSG